MEVLEKGIILLLKAAVTGEAQQLPEGFELEAAVPQLKRHSVLPLAYEGAVKCGFDAKAPVMQGLFRDYVRAYMHNEAQMTQLQRMFDAFEAHSIDYLPLKGSRMKQLYPKPELRLMGDADILIRESLYGSIVPVMQELGFADEGESDHQLLWRHPSLFVELHRGLMNSSNKDFCRYFGDGWKFAEGQHGHYWTMSPEDEYVFLFSHFAKHYRDGGIGLRHVLDLWVYARSYPSLDHKRIKNAMQALRLERFHENILRLIDCWFCDGTEDELTAYISAFVFSSGNWGNKENQDISGVLKRLGKNRTGLKGKLVYALQTVFPSASRIEREYPVLRKRPYLLPFMWVLRFFRKVFTFDIDFKERKRDFSSINDGRLDTRAAELERVGLSIEF